MTISLNQHLVGLNGDILKAWLRRAGAHDKTLTRKDQFARAIEQVLTLNLPKVLALLSDPEKQFLAESAHQKRLISEREFAAKYGGACPIPKTYYAWGEEVSLLAAFIHFPDARDGDEPRLISSLVDSLRALLPKPGKLEVRFLDTPPKTWPSEEQCQEGELIRPVHVFESERIAPVELGRVLRLIHGGKVKVTDATHRPTDATTRLVGEALVVPDFALEMPEAHFHDSWDRKYYQPAGPVRAHAWPVLVQQCGWARSKGGVLSLTEAGQDILRQFTPEKFRAGVSRCLAHGDFDELNRIPHLRGQGGKAKRWMSNPALRKTAITQAMTTLPVGQWLEFEEARRLVEASPENWNVLKEGSGVLYFAELQYGCIYETTGINRQFLRAFFMESLATLGVLDSGWVYPHHLWPELGGLWGTDDLYFCGRYDGLLYARLNPLGAWALGFADQYELRVEASPKLFHVLPNLDVVLAGEMLNPADRAMLELLAAPKSDTVWTLAPERMLTHVETGGDFQELRDFLEANAVEDLPDEAQLLLDDLEDNLGACQSLHESVLLEWRDPRLATFLATHPGTNKLCFHAGENRLVVPSQHLAAFRRALKKLGYVLPGAKP